jgi:catechol 2,3-dioxygenase-like lactoylglutathione lyase family enzyme
MPDQPFGLTTIGQVLVPVADAERATAFYRDRLGMRFLFAFPGMAFFDADGVRLYLATPEDPGFAGRATLYFRVPDIAAAVEALEARGVAFTSNNPTWSTATPPTSCGWPSRPTPTATTSA